MKVQEESLKSRDEQITAQEGIMKRLESRMNKMLQEVEGLKVQDSGEHVKKIEKLIKKQLRKAGGKKGSKIKE